MSGASNLNRIINEMGNGYVPTILVPINYGMLTLDLLFKKKKTLWPLFMDGVQLPQGYSHSKEAVYFLSLSSQKFLVLILSTSDG